MSVVPLLMIILIIAAGLSAVSYTYFVSVSTEIDDIVREDLRRQARTEAFQVTKSLEREIVGVANNVATAASRLAIISGDLENGADLINGMQQSTAGITDRYLWLDREGKTIWSSAFAGNQQEYDQFRGFDVSDRPYFAHPASTMEPYLGPVIQSLDGSQRMFISYPILDNEEFKGVIVGSLRADSFGQLVQSKLSQEIESSIGVIDPNGVIVYTRDASLIGENLFGDKVQSVLAPAFNSEEQLAEFNDFLETSLQDDVETNSRDFRAISGPTTTIIATPVIVSGVDVEYHFLTLYLTAPHNIAYIVGPLVEQQRTFSIAVISAIAAATALVAYIVVSWNKRLEKTVEERTASLTKAHEQLKIHDKMQTEFINIAAHELRTPVQPLLNIAELLEEDLAKGVDEIKVSKAEVEMLTRNAKRMAQLAEDLLEVARIDSDSLRLQKEKIDLKEKIHTTIEDSKVLIKERQAVDIIFEEPGENGILVEADTSRLFEVLSNLIRNAIKFTKEGTISIKLQQNDGYAQVSVKDTGTGIDPSIFPRLFEKFASKADKGTGLGLYITKKIIEAHGGKIWAENNPEGKGATFTFTLPMTTITKERVEEAATK